MSEPTFMQHVAAELLHELSVALERAKRDEADSAEQSILSEARLEVAKFARDVAGAAIDASDALNRWSKP